MADAAELILRTLDKHLAEPADIRLMGGAALILAYGLARATEDADLLLDDAELQALAERGFGEALEATNRDLEGRGLYISHIWGPEQQILTPGWRGACRPLMRPRDLERLRVTALGPLDLIVSKLCRADDEDLADIRFLIERESLAPEQVRAALQSAVVPPDFAAVYPTNRAKVEALLRVTFAGSGSPTPAGTGS